MLPTLSRSKIWPGAEQIDQLRSMLDTAERPLVLLGGSRWSEEAQK